MSYKMFIHNINPVIFSIGSMHIRWYGLMYVISFIFLYYMLSYLAKRKKIKLTQSDIEWFVIIETAALVVGARLFEVLVYSPSYYFANPAKIIAVWEGGLSFHGGLIGMVIATYYFCKAKKVKFLEIADLLVIPMGIALMLGRIGNFINGELYGTVTNVPWCVKFPSASGCRHPSQLYEAGKNLLIFIALWAIKDRKEKPGFFFAVFLIMYGILRFLIEFVREPESMVGFLTLGQFLCVLMIAAGGILLWHLNKD
ncbi:prolipoprotein diacylglyceryl transferase [Candidatus Woesearchaeota archaeon]|nr:prolipoprotein diacylglyceryl transferase [Candidatus Woesearchaeota archaeon]